MMRCSFARIKVPVKTTTTRGDELSRIFDRCVGLDAFGNDLVPSDDVRLDVKVFHGPELSGPIETHLNLVNEQDVTFVENLFEAGPEGGSRELQDGQQRDLPNRRVRKE
jgi:hypothetical protein